MIERINMSNAFYTEMMEYSQGLACINNRFIHQGNRRWKYFEQDGYRKLSDILQIENYSTFIDVYMLAHYITGIIPDEYDEDEIGDVEDIYEYVSDVIRYNKSEDINWENIINYVDEQKEAINEQDDEYEGLQRLYNLLISMKDELLTRNDAFCLY
jgi:hypothetical protein